VDFPKESGAHTAFPLLDVDIEEFAQMKNGKVRNFLVVPGESLANDCAEARQMVHILDITNEAAPIGVAAWTVPEASGNFCSRGGRFGTHSSNESFTPVYYKRVMFFTHFNAGVRAVDVRDPFHPKEIAYFIPAVTDKTDQQCAGSGAAQRCSRVIQTNNVEVDDRGYIYIVDRANSGLDILQLSGTARALANLP
jgi:hypothetical protein